MYISRSEDAIMTLNLAKLLLKVKIKMEEVVVVATKAATSSSSVSNVSKYFTYQGYDPRLSKNDKKPVSKDRKGLETFSSNLSKRFYVFAMLMLQLKYVMGP